MNTVTKIGIAEFFVGRSIFITGASGFMGKVLVEKLLRSCPGIVKIYILLRPGRTGTIQDKMNKITSLPIFDRLKSERPGDLESKLVPIEGNMMELGLGITVKDRAMLIKEVSIVYHLAATVRFNQALTDAIIMNVRGTREVCDLVLDIKTNNPNILFLHISTAFSNCDHKVVEEHMYPPHADWRRSIQIAEDLDEHTLQVLTAKYSNSAPNTYIFTKSLAEHVVNDLCGGGGNTVIMRPSIVTSTYEEPVPGWLDNYNGPIGILIASGTGVSRIAFCNPDSLPDFVPVDFSIKYIINITWKHGTDKSFASDKDVNIYNSSLSNIKAISAKEVIRIGIKYAPEVPFNKLLWKPSKSYTGNSTLYYINVLLFHILPAIFLDGIGKCMGIKVESLFKIQRKIFIATIALKHFLFNDWNFKNAKLLNLEEELPRDEYETFGTDPHNIDVEKFYKNAIIGIKKYLLKEDMNKLNQDKTKYQKMFYLDLATKFVLYSSVVWLSFFKYNLLGVILNLY